MDLQRKEIKKGEVHGHTQAPQDDEDPLDEVDKEQSVDRGDIKSSTSWQSGECTVS